MSWRDQMQEGKFRNVSFRAKSQSTEGGRRVTRHEYPGRNHPWPEDLGRKARTHTLELHIIGADYMVGRDAMLNALEQVGPGELVHPWLGRLQVQVETYSLSETTSEGGKATFSVTFTEAGKQQFPSAKVDTSAVVISKADLTVASIVADFANKFNVSGLPGWVAHEASAVIDGALDSIHAAMASVPGILLEITDFNRGLAAFQTSLNTLLQTASDLGDGMAGIVTSVINSSADPVSALQRLEDFGTAMKLPPLTTVARKAQALNQQASIDLIQRLAVIEQSRVSALITPASSRSAIELRDSLAEKIEDLLETASDDVYLALVDLRTAVIKDLTSRAAKSPQLSSFTPKTTLPALVLAHRIYGDANRDVEIIARNHISHSGFVSGGSPLEVIRAD